MSTQDLHGKQVGHYLVLSLLASGAGGSVYRAIDITLHNSPTYAIKCVAKSGHVRRLCQQEAEIINHDTVILCPHVLMLSDFFEEGYYFFLVFPLCEMDMSTAIFEKRMYWRNDTLIKKAFVEVLDGVFACHKKGVFHRDLKPENIMCNAQGTKIKIGDFGLSTNRRLCRDGGCGTVPYMSPECLDEKEFCYDANLVDIWALGVILFNMVTRRYPWEEARRTDKEYMAYLSEKDYLLRTSPISVSLSELLCQIWQPKPMKRMSIPAIRQAVTEIDTFYGPLHSSHIVSPLSKEALFKVDSQQTCVAPAGDNENKDSGVPMNALEEALRHLELKI